MEIARTIAEVRGFLAGERAAGKTVGLSPTMGALHDGHLSLVRRSDEENDCSVVSIFVNPTQFGPAEDLSKYPRNEAKDCDLLAAAGCDLVFLPSVEAMYPPDACTTVTVAGLTDGLCGTARPGHFAGVCTIVLKLFNIVQPNRAYFGLKDAQQYFVVRQLARDLDLPLQVRPVAIRREHDGLAMSSRNLRLTAKQRSEAPAINQGIRAAQHAYGQGERRPEVLVGLIREAVGRTSGVIDYVELVELPTMGPLSEISGPSLLAAAVFFGDVRLIDNAILGDPEGL